MKNIALLAVALVLASAVPLSAQVASGPAVPAKPKATCPCEAPNFKPLNDKARAVADYWAARRKYKIASRIAGGIGLLGIIGRDLKTIRQAEIALSAADAEIFAARSKAESLGGIKTTGGDDSIVEIKLKKGVDYTAAP